MNRRRILRLISLVMLVVAVIFVFCALSNPTLGNVIYIGTFKFGSDLWRVCYVIYTIVMVTLFCASFFIKNKK